MTDHNNSDQSTSLDNPQRISFFDYFFVFVLVLYAGRANTFFIAQSVTENPLGVFIPVMLSGILAFRWRIVYNVQFYLLIFFFSIYFLAVSVKYQEIQPTFFIFYLFLFFVSYTAVKALKFNLFTIYEKILYWFAIIALFMWSVQIALGGDTLLGYLSSISKLESTSYVTGYGVSAIIYSVQPLSKGLLHDIMIPRNSGYAWEPGAFAVYLCLALFINLFNPKPDENNKKRFWVLLIALLSTQSTTGYVIFMLIMVFYVINKNLQKVLLLLPVLVVVLIFISSLPFMKDKILEYIDDINRIDYIVEGSIGRQSAVNPQRFASFKIAFIDFLDNPVLGLAAHREETWTYKIGANISSISGIGNLMAQFGLIGFLFFMILTIRSSFLFAWYFNYKGRFLLFFVIMLISVSYTIIFIPLIMCFWMFSLIEQPEEKLAEIKVPDN